MAMRNLAVETLAQKSTRRLRCYSPEAQAWFDKGLSAPTANRLAEYNIITIEELREFAKEPKYFDAMLGRIPGLGKKSIQELRLLLDLPVNVWPLLRKVADDVLAQELRQRGWTVEPPSQKRLD
jgi:hypothetical protein